MNVDMRFNQAQLCFNTCMLTNSCFGCGIVNFNEKQCEELKKICELLTTRK